MSVCGAQSDYKQKQAEASLVGESVKSEADAKSNVSGAITQVTLHINYANKTCRSNGNRMPHSFG